MDKMLTFKLYCESKEEFYTRIDSLPDEGYDIWTDKEIKKLEDWFKNNQKNYRLSIPSGRVSVINITMPDCDMGICDMGIYKLEDDWWIVNTFLEADRQKFYLSYKWKCDQWEGVVELLEDLRYCRWI
jgi:hypothetical protein